MQVGNSVYGSKQSIKVGLEKGHTENFLVWDDKTKRVILVVYHLLFSVAAFYLISEKGGDAQNYWFLNENLSEKNWQDFFRPGTDVVKWIAFPLVKYFHLPFWAGFIFFSLISSLGVLLLYKVMMEISGNSKILNYFSVVLLLLPNFHFWSSIIGKEALLLPFLILIIFKLHRKQYFSPFIFGALFFIGLIRPHVAFILMLSYILSLLIVIKSAMKYKLMLLIVLGICTVVFTAILVRIQNFEGGVARVLHKYNTHMQYFKKTDAYVPMDQYGLPLKIFTFYFRPLPFEKTGLGYVIVSWENAVLFLFSLGTGFFALKFFKTLSKQILFVFPTILLLFIALMYVFAYANYGIISRTKMMTLPFLFILMLTVMSAAFSKQNVQKKADKM